MNIVTEAIAEEVDRRGLSQYELAKLSGVDQGAISRLLGGGDIRCDTAGRLMAAMSLTIGKE
jgi:transcriptional regulator with XRE-family HTH domain